MQNVVKYRRASVYRREGRRWAWALRMWASTVHFVRILEARLSLLKFTITVTSFLVFLCVLPGLFLLYTGIKCWRAAVGAWATRAMEGVEELAGVTVRGAMETPTSPAVDTLLLSLSGAPSVAFIREKIMEEVVGRRDAGGRLLHPNLQRRLEQVGGYHVWRRHQDFDIAKHVTLAPRHYQGRLLTSRNVQEYVSEVVSQPLPEHLPPWNVTVIETFDGLGGGDGETWVVARAHHLLASTLTLPDLLVTAYPDPWRTPASRSLTLLAAPAATARLIDAVATGATETAMRAARICSCWWQERGASALTPAIALLREAALVARKVGPDALPLLTTALYVIIILKGRIKVRANSLQTTVQQYIAKCSVQRCALLCVAWAAGMWWRAVVWSLLLPWTAVWWGRELVRRGKALAATQGFSMMMEAVVEVYWMARAFVSLPRLVLEEAISVRRVTPLMGWIGRRKRMLSRRGMNTRGGGATVAWSDPVPLSTVRGVRGATGATLGEVLLTASAGAVRDYLRVTGLPVPEEVCCTVPVHSQRWAEARTTVATSPALVTLALPTGAAEASTALQLLRQSLENIRNYPERYLASKWLMKNLAYFLPVSLLGSAFRALSARYPVLMSNLSGPPEPVALWGHDLLNIFYWRPPQDGAVLSVCVTSYRGQALMGVAAERRVVSSAASLPQAFVTHLNELAVDVGVRPERPSSQSWFRYSTSTPSPTPPATPILGSTKPLFFPQWNKHRLAASPLHRRRSTAF